MPVAAGAHGAAIATRQAHAEPALTPSGKSVAVVLAQLHCVLDATRPPPQTVAVAGRLTPAQCRALVAVRDHPGVSVTALAQRLGVRQPTASALVKALAARRLVSARRSTHDRRTIHIQLLSSGRNQLVVQQQLQVPPLQAALGVVGDTTLAGLTAGLDALLHQLDVRMTQARMIDTRLVLKPRLAETLAGTRAGMGGSQHQHPVALDVEGFNGLGRCPA